MKCTNKKWKLKKTLVLKKSQKIKDKFALEKFITVFLAARSAEEKQIERRFLRIMVTQLSRLRLFF